MSNRFFLDIRVGSLAIKDSRTSDPCSPGLNEHTPGVIKYWNGFVKDICCETCGHQTRSEWRVRPEDEEEATVLCAALNKETK